MDEWKSYIQFSQAEEAYWEETRYRVKGKPKEQGENKIGRRIESGDSTVRCFGDVVSALAREIVTPDVSGCGNERAGMLVGGGGGAIKMQAVNKEREL